VTNRPTCIVRFYQWQDATVSLGKNQTAEKAVALDYCLRHKIPVVHRPTGGRAVYHDEELTYAVVSNDATLFGPSLSSAYLCIGRALRTGLRELGINCEMTRGSWETAQTFRNNLKQPCFAAPSRYELTVESRKIAGSAQRRLRNCFLQHGSIPLSINYEKWSSVLDFKPAQLHAKVISVAEAAGHPVTFADLVSVLKEGFEYHLKKTDL
jgi:lipoate-protein ligase A